MRSSRSAAPGGSVPSSTRDLGGPHHAPDGSNERFADLVKGDQAEIMFSYEKSLVEWQSPLTSDPLSRQRILADCAQILKDIEESVRANTTLIDDAYKRLACPIGEAVAVSNLSPADSLRAALELFNITTNALARHVRQDPALLPSFVIAVIALNESIDRRLREATLAYTGYLLNRIHRAHWDERRRIARELHDRLGEGVSGALRQLELHELTEPDQANQPAFHTSLAKGALMEAMDRLRLVISDLRREPVTSLKDALSEYIAAVAANTDVRVCINGDEGWAAPSVIDETFMILREALRNAITHADPRLVRISVSLVPHELRARVEDDGQGFELQRYATCGPARRAGLATMGERAALIGGSLCVSSSPGQGTHVELHVPLLGTRDEPPG